MGSWRGLGVSSMSTEFVQYIRAPFLVVLAVRELNSAKAVPLIEATGSGICLESVKPNWVGQAAHGSGQQPGTDTLIGERRGYSHLSDPGYLAVEFSRHCSNNLAIGLGDYDSTSWNQVARHPGANFGVRVRRRSVGHEFGPCFDKQRRHLKRVSSGSRAQRVFH